MKDKVFADSNVLLYLLDKDDVKKAKAEEILFSNPVVSTQVVNENIHVAHKKFHLPKTEIFNHVENIFIKCHVKTVSPDSIQLACIIFDKYQYGYYDCLIIASAIENDCKILYSEDLQHNQLIDKKLRIINPFVK